MVEEWLERHVREYLEECPPELRGWAIGRGLRGSMFSEMQICIWRTTKEKCPDPGFAKRMGLGGKARDGWMLIPYWSPRGVICGGEFRTWGEEAELDGKTVRDYRTPKSKFAPVFLGMTPSVLEKIWRGADVWIVEGVFDLSLYHVIPERDVVLGCGTARLTRTQINFLKRFLSPSSQVYLAWDEDETGQRQALGYFDPKLGKEITGAVARLERKGIRVRHVRYRGGKDPGDIWERGGKPALERSFNL